MKPSSESHAREMARQSPKATAATVSDTAPMSVTRRRDGADGEGTVTRFYPPLGGIPRLVCGDSGCYTDLPEGTHENQGGKRARAHPQGRGHPLGLLLPHQQREQRPRRGRRTHPDDGRGALRGRGRGCLLAGDLRQADRRLHGDGQPQCRRHPDGLRRHRPGLGGFFPAPGHGGGAGAGREPAHPLRHARGLPLGDQVGGRGGPGRARSPTTCAAPSPICARGDRGRCCSWCPAISASTTTPSTRTRR